MIQVEKADEIYICMSCYKNKRDNNVNVYMVSVGFDKYQLASFKLCKSCLLDVKRGVELAK